MQLRSISIYIDRYNTYHNITSVSFLLSVYMHKVLDRKQERRNREDGKRGQRDCTNSKGGSYFCGDIVAKRKFNKV